MKSVIVESEVGLERHLGVGVLDPRRLLLAINKLFLHVTSASWEVLADEEAQAAHLAVLAEALGR